MAYAAYQFNSVKRMEDARVTRHDKSDAGILAFGQPLGGDVGFEFKEIDRFLDANDIFFADGGDFIDDTRNGCNGNLCAAGNIFYTDF